MLGLHLPLTENLTIVMMAMMVTKRVKFVLLIHRQNLMIKRILRAPTVLYVRMC